MGDLWRSQEMQLVQLFVQIEAAHDTVDELGELGLVQFRDLNPTVNAFQRNFVNEVKRADEMERKLRFFEQLITKANTDKDLSQQPIPVAPIPTDGRDRELSMDELETRFEELEKELQQMNNNQEMLNRNHNELIELKYVLEKDEEFFAQAGQRPDLDGGRDTDLLLGRDEETFSTSTSGGVKLGFVTGVVPRDKFATFERVLFRATRGNLYMKYTEVDEDIKDPKDGKPVKKYVFIVFFQGDKLQTKIKKICESFDANLYPCPDSPNERKELLAQVNTRLDDLRVVIARTLEHRRQVLFDVGRQLSVWQMKVRKEKAIYHTMNMFNYDVGRRCLIAEGWCPKSSIEDVQLALRKARDRSGALVPSILSIIKPTEEPPTYFKVNKFTRAFQNIVDAYGVARYREINPAVFTIVTFPFLFGIMFGDVGHGILLLLATLFMIYKEKEWQGQELSEMIATPFEGRYVMLLMAIFGIYCGFIYNEFFSVPMNIFGSRFECCESDNVTYYIKEGQDQRVYPIGVDPVWKGAGNELLYYNSLKMKNAIILGVIQMCLGIFMKMFNAIYFRQELDLFFEFIPQILLMLALFGYLCFLIVLKWLTPFHWQDMELAKVNSTLGSSATFNSPMLLNTMIYMFLNPFSAPEGAVELFKGQFVVQGILLILAFICVPWMLLPKPLILRARHNKKMAAKRAAGGNSAHEEEEHDDHEGGGGHGHGHGEFDFGEMFVHQVIETIEFVLGSVSNTASYLRLWALSLAHSELSTVFWDMGLISLGVKNGPIGVVIIFAVWTGVTVGVLLIMETLSAFLHALRLHWVEFQNKFYKGDGKKFLPFSYERMFSGEEEAQ